VGFRLAVHATTAHGIAKKPPEPSGHSASQKVRLLRATAPTESPQLRRSRGAFHNFGKIKCETTPLGSYHVSMSEYELNTSALRDQNRFPCEAPTSLGPILASDDITTLAEHFLIGTRTAEKWRKMGLLVGVRRGRAIHYNLAECERVLLNRTVMEHGCKRPRISPLDLGAQPQMGAAYATTEMLAHRYCVNEKTIDNWKRSGLLTYVQIGRVVRYNSCACDSSLRACGNY